MYQKHKTKRTEIADLGEFGLIRHLTGDVNLVNSSTLKGVGDDAAVIKADERELLVSTDLLIEGVHFNLAYTPLRHLGYKAAVVNISDIAAMNGVAEQITVSIAISNRFSLEALEEFYEGIALACKHYKVDLIGGDTSSSTSGLFISITVIGRALQNEIVYRSGAKENDLVFVSGDLGGAYMGLLLLEREKTVYAVNPSMQPDLEGNDYILERQLKPEARTDIISLLKSNGVQPTAMIDISDGLASELMHICENSEVGCAVYEEKIPIDPATVGMAEEFKIDPTIAALSGGEDYELLFTISQNDYEKVKNIEGISAIGHITNKDSGRNLVSRDGTMIPITAQGWDAFLKKSDSY